MPEAIAKAKNVRIAPRKARLVADLVRGKRVDEARSILAYTPKGAAPIIRKVLESAVANAEFKAEEHNERLDPDEMVVRRIVVNEGLSFRFFRPAARGRAAPRRRRFSHIEVLISDE
jgi:large subunit ribosomal protein L22